MYDFDFGTVVASGQILKHEFGWENPTEKTAKIVSSTVNVPCCSHLGTLPESVPAHSSVLVPAFLQVGRVADFKRVTFAIETDDPVESGATFALQARFVPELEILATAESQAPLLIGQAARRSYRMIGRRKDGEGRTAPAEVIATEPLRIESISPANEIKKTDGIIESSRQVIVGLPARGKFGVNRSPIILRWADGLIQQHDVTWTVEPRIRVDPPLLVVKPRDFTQEMTIEVRSADRPFGISRVSGPLLAGEGPTSPRASLTHLIRLTLDPDRFVTQVKPEIEIVTDDPDQPLLKLGVLVTPHPEAKP